MKRALDPTQIVILGGSGDLSARKLLPALFDLYLKSKLPEQFQIIGLARTPRSHQAYRKFVKSALTGQNKDYAAESLRSFCAHVFYVAGSFEAAASYKSLQATLMQFQEAIGLCTNRLFYLAVPPQFYEQIFEQLHYHNMHEPCDVAHGWTRILVEKPFGADYHSARALDEKIGLLFKEEQIFRIDHYLAKEAVQNILSFRFANPILAPAWNRHSIASIKIEMKETIDVGERGSFYESVGALRDVGQNHLLQILALMTMQQPAVFDAEHIRRERVYILEALRPYDPVACDGEVVRGQYVGFLETDGIDIDSNTETYFELTTYLDTKDWAGVPIYIRAGKGLDEQVVRVTVTFKNVTEGLFNSEDFEVPANEITLQLNPTLDMEIVLNTKKPGYEYDVAADTLNLHCRSTDGVILNSYEKVLLDCINGDQTLFASTGEVLAAWKYVTSILERWGTQKVIQYLKGSGGPKRLS